MQSPYEIFLIAHVKRTCKNWRINRSTKEFLKFMCFTFYQYVITY